MGRSIATAATMTRGTILALLALGSVAPSAAQGCGPTRLKVAESVTLDVPPLEAWRLVGNFQDMSWAQNTRATTGSGGNVPDKAVRAVALHDGATLNESLYKYDAEAMNYSYHIDQVDTAVLPVQNVSATIEVVGTSGGLKSTIRWRAAFYRFLKADEPAADLADAAATKAVSTWMRKALDGLKTKVEAKT